MVEVVLSKMDGELEGGMEWEDGLPLESGRLATRLSSNHHWLNFIRHPRHSAVDGLPTSVSVFFCQCVPLNIQPLVCAC